jgi:phosphate/sulfate permease
MSIDKLVLLFAGTVLMIATTLAWTVSAKFLIVTGFVGANLFQSALTGFCPLAILLRRVGARPGTLYR